MKLILLIIGTDQCSKLLANNLLESSKEISLFYSLVTFSLVQNFGGFLGIVNDFSDSARFFLLNICVSLLLLGCLLYVFAFKKKTARYDVPLMLVCAGGMSNLLDRLLHNGGVTDFLSIGIGWFRTGIFNLADVFILVGSFILGFALFTPPANPTLSPQAKP